MLMILIDANDGETLEDRHENKLLSIPPRSSLYPSQSTVFGIHLKSQHVNVTKKYFRLLS